MATELLLDTQYVITEVPASAGSPNSPRKAVHRMARQEIGAWQQPRVIAVAARFGQRVWQMRQLLGLSRDQLARRAVISIGTVKDIEHGRPMDLCYQVLIAEKGLGVPWERINCSDAGWQRFLVKAEEYWASVKEDTKRDVREGVSIFD